MKCPQCNKENIEYHVENKKPRRIVCKCLECKWDWQYDIPKGKKTEVLVKELDLERHTYKGKVKVERISETERRAHIMSHVGELWYLLQPGEEYTLQIDMDNDIELPPGQPRHMIKLVVSKPYTFQLTKLTANKLKEIAARKPN